jgi:hypothetical protein
MPHYLFETKCHANLNAMEAHFHDFLFSILVKSYRSASRFSPIILKEIAPDVPCLLCCECPRVGLLAMAKKCIPCF